ncbi:MAG TPA: CoA transferase [Dehalococcoidia bacterium]|nr:CoA transferase [Dehalococcoidia bacterium]
MALEVAMQGALSGVRVLDFSEYIAGPYAGQMLADMGADVIKVEPPQGDFWRLSNMIAPSESRGFIGVNKGKRSISIDLKRDEAREVLRRAVLRSDVLLQNYRPGVAERLGLDYESVSLINPRLIYVENTAFGTVGPYAGKAGFDLVSQAMTGIMAYEGGAGLPRSIVTTAVTDISSGMFMAFAVASALYQRERTGKGQKIENSLFAAGVAIQYRPMLSIEAQDREAREQLLRDLEEGRKAGKRYEEILGERRPGRPPSAVGPYYRAYEARDGYMVIACLNNRLRRAVRDVVGVDDPRVDGDEFAVMSLGPERAAEITAEMEAIIATKSVAEWCEAFDAVGVPCGPVRLPAEMFEDEHVRVNNLIVELEHPVVGPIKMANSPLKMSGAETGAKSASPALGQHTREYLGELGFEAGEIEALLASGVVREWRPRISADFR